MSPEPRRLPRALQPLATPIYRRIWTAAMASNVGTWMQTVGAAWLMATLSTSPLMVALVQTASSLPAFLLAAPAGAIADMVDRRKLLIATQTWMLVAAALLGGLTLAGLTGPYTLLLLTFALGLGSAMNAPAWQATVPQLVPPQQLPSAVALNSVQFNIARAIGPAIGGLVISAWNTGAAFVLNALSFLGVVVVLWHWKGERDAKRSTEPVWPAMRAGWTYVKSTAPFRGVLIRSGVFVFGASALWAMLPVVAKHELSGSSRGYGLLLGCLGAGSVMGAFFFARLRGTIQPDALVAAGTVLFACATAALGYIERFDLLCAAMLAGGIAWMCVMSTFNVAAQIALPAWVRARALSFYILVFQGTMAVGGWAWGQTAAKTGTRQALFIAAAALLIGIVSSPWFPMHEIHEPELTPEMHWPEPAITSEVIENELTRQQSQPRPSRH
jgi:MFS family permease